MTNLKKLICGIVWAAACFCATPVVAQEQSEEKPKPAARDYGPLVETGDDLTGTEQSTGVIQPDSLPASGMQNLTLGTPPMRHSYVVPGIQYGNTYSGGAEWAAAGSKTTRRHNKFVCGAVKFW